MTDTAPRDPRWPAPDGAGLRACLVNCTLKRSPRRSHTAGLLDVVAHVFSEAGVEVDRIRAADHRLPPGMKPDMTDDGYEVDEWPELADRVLRAHILVIGTPIWLSAPSSVCTRVIERLYSLSGETNDRGQYLYYGRTAGCIVTGNEDGVKSVSREVLYALQHIGYTIPPQADAGWIGEVGPGPSYLDEGSGGPSSDFTQRNTTFMAWNLMHCARMLVGNNGYPAHGNVPAQWEAGERFGHPGLGWIAPERS